MRVTIKRIAELAGVSKTSVSFAFNDPKKISRETYNRIMAIADREGYVPDPVARTMTTKRVGSIGVLLPQAIQETFKNPYVAEVLRGIGEVCHEDDLFLTILPPVKGFLSQAVRNAAVDGFIALGVEAAPKIVELIRQRHVPFVTIDGDEVFGIPNIGIDDEAAAESVMEYVLSRGHERIAVLALQADGPKTEEERSSKTSEKRLSGFSRALARYGLALDSPSITVQALPATMEAASETCHRILEKRPTLIVCMSDTVALGVYEACAALGRRIPEDISVTGMDDIPFAALLAPPLTTVRQPGVRKGAYAARSIIDLIAGKPAASVRLPTDLIIRSSVARIA